MSSVKGDITGGDTQGKSPVRRSRDYHQNLPPSQESISNKLSRQTTKTKKAISHMDNHVDRIDP